MGLGGVDMLVNVINDEGYGFRASKSDIMSGIHILG